VLYRSLGNWRFEELRDPGGLRRQGGESGASPGVTVSAVLRKPGPRSPSAAPREVRPQPDRSQQHPDASVNHAPTMEQVFRRSHA